MQQLFRPLHYTKLQSQQGYLIIANPVKTVDIYTLTYQLDSQKCIASRQAGFSGVRLVTEFIAKAITSPISTVRVRVYVAIVSIPVNVREQASDMTSPKVPRTCLLGPLHACIGETT